MSFKNYDILKKVEVKYCNISRRNAVEFNIKEGIYGKIDNTQQVTQNESRGVRT